jgi:plasmid stabilization system protein ParE
MLKDQTLLYLSFTETEDSLKEEPPMPQGDKSSYTDKQKRQAEHIETSYEKKGFSTETAEARAWATVNKLSGGGKKSGSGRNGSKN